jgi:hypothetical protein
MTTYYWKTAGHCTRCSQPFAPDALMHIVVERAIRTILGGEGGLVIYNKEASPVCDTCLEPREQAPPWVDRTCGGCSHAMRFYHQPSRSRRHPGHRARVWCSSRCEQRVRRAWRKVVVEKSCATCNKPFFPARRDAAYCSNACRQWNYRARSR